MSTCHLIKACAWLFSIFIFSVLAQAFHLVFQQSHVITMKHDQSEGVIKHLLSELFPLDRRMVENLVSLYTLGGSVWLRLKYTCQLLEVPSLEFKSSKARSTNASLLWQILHLMSLSYTVYSS